MMSTTDELLGVVVDPAGNRSLVGATFVNRRFPELAFGPALPGANGFVIENTRFENCQVDGGQYRVFNGVVLRDVSFVDVSSRDAFTISTNAVLDHVTVKGTPKRGGLWVKPFEVFDKSLEEAYRDWVHSMTSSIDVMLDISAYRGPEVEIVGLPVEKIMIDRELHVIIRREWRNSLDWQQLEISPTSFIRSRLTRLLHFGAEAGIYDLPKKSEPNYEQTMREISQLRLLGLL